jgi:hypothetical protein
VKHIFILRLALPVALITCISSCGTGGDGGGTPTSPPPVIRSGTATLSLSSAPPGIAAVRLRLAGRGMSAPVPSGTVRILLQRTVADTMVLVLGVADGSAQQLLTVSLANLDQPFDLAVQEVAGGKAAGYRAFAATDVVVSAAKR